MSESKHKGPRRKKKIVVDGKFVREQWVGSDKVKPAPQKKRSQTVKDNKKASIMGLVVDGDEIKSSAKKKNSVEPKSVLKTHTALEINKMKGVSVGSGQIAVIPTSILDPKTIKKLAKKSGVILTEAKDGNVAVYVKNDSYGSLGDFGVSGFALNFSAKDNKLEGDASWKKVADLEGEGNQFIIADPAQIVDDETYRELTEMKNKIDAPYGYFAESKGFALSSVYGDGPCPVAAKADPNSGKVASLSVTLDNDLSLDDDDDDDLGMDFDDFDEYDSY